MLGSEPGETDRRAKRALEAVERYGEVAGADINVALPEMLSDIMHLCDRTTMWNEFGAALERARLHYNEEILTDLSEEANRFQNACPAVPREGKAKLISTSGVPRSSAAQRNEGRLIVPPDPEGLNDQWATFSLEATRAFQRCSRTDRGAALGDLLAALMHLCDRDPRYGDFDAELALAHWHYQESTAAD
ncbi:hypothetical protein AAW00_13220 [Aurantiacibacter luteus]|uniref:Uncharacterized protein n=2 Tax=Aurantiacibacter luteus TaxID=1581420 RepID=A0A0G9MNU8_9SPHN|nr:hypothetical protein AAW00_13220 [Aurantiacibacter luteus]